MVKDSIFPAESTQARILLSAREIFFIKGMAGARMQEIADHAGINKALLHYYFRNKETLFDAVFGQTILTLLPDLIAVFQSDRPLLEKIPAFFSIHIGFIQANPKIPHFIITEVSRNPDMILKGFKALNQQKLFDQFAIDVSNSIKKGEIKPIDPMQLIINLLSLSVFPFLARPLLVTLFGLEEVEFEKFMENRKTEVANFVINALK
jgi:AcrR family transcriptional regulator